MQITIIGARTEEQRELYEELSAIAKPYGKVISPIDTAQFNGTDKEQYKRAMESIFSAHIIIAEVSTASTGLGIELQEAVKQKKQIICLSKSGTVVSSLIRGLPGQILFVTYHSFTDAVEKVNTALTKCKNATGERDMKRILDIK